MSAIQTMKIQPQVEIEVYKRRWLMILLFVLAGITNGFQLIHYAFISKIISQYYRVSLMDIDWLAMCYMISYIILIIPFLWILQKQSFRFTLVLSSFINALGTIVSGLGIQPPLYLLVLFGQIISSTAGIAFLTMPAPIAAAWFASSEISTATAIGVFAIEFGAALGCLLPPLIVHKSENMMEIKNQLLQMAYGKTALTVLSFLLIVLFFQSHPPKPPSIAQWKILNSPRDQINILQSIITILKHPDMILLSISYGLSLSTFYAFETLLSQIILFYYEGEEKSAGQMGLICNIMGSIGAIVAGIWLDKTHSYKKTFVGLNVMACIVLIVFTVLLRLLHQNLIWIIFVITSTLGFFNVGMFPIGLEFAAEISYPESESLSSGILLATVQLFAIISITGGQSLLDHYGAMAVNIALSSLLFCSIIIAAFIKGDLKRLKANESK